MKQFNEKAVTGLYHSSAAGRAILNELAAMPRQNETLMEGIIDRLANGVDLWDNKPAKRRADVTSFFKKLEEYGAGEYIVGRRGHDSRFKWTVDSINLATVEVPAIQIKQHEIPSPVTHRTDTTVSVLIQHSFQLRQDLAIKLALPADITSAEAHRLGQFLLSLPFGND